MYMYTLLAYVYVIYSLCCTGYSIVKKVYQYGRNSYRYLYQYVHWPTAVLASTCTVGYSYMYI